MPTPAHHAAWRQLVTGKVPGPFQFLALQLMVQRMTNRFRSDPSEASVSEMIDYARSFFAKHERLLAADEKLIFGGK
jgi:hypothetical protein